MMKKIKVFIKRPGAVPYSTNISNSLENLQKTVGGYIETATVAEDFTIICNEEGLINDLPFNCTLLGNYFFGTLIFAGVKNDEFVDVPISFQKFKKLFPQLWNVKGEQFQKQIKLEQAASELCDNYCKFPDLISDEDELDAVCMKCPLNKVFDLLTKDCSDCVYYNTDRKDQPCCSCADKINFKKKG